MGLKDRDPNHTPCASDTSSFERYDIFVSHRYTDADRVAPLVEALRQQRLKVWFDIDTIEDHVSISHSVRDGVARSKILLAYYSRDYPKSRACQWELTAAFTAAQRAASGNPRDRVLVINPERTNAGETRTDHIFPVELRDALLPAVEASDASDAAAWTAEARRIATIVAGVHQTLGDERVTAPRQVGRRLIGAPGFVGRIQEMWSVHTALSSSDAVMVTGASGGEIAQLTGMGGVGKSLLAEEYALRFGAAYPGGVFWISAADIHAKGREVAPDERAAARHTQLRSIAQHLGIVVEGRSPEEITGVLSVTLEEFEPSLWIVDDLPPNLTAGEARAWLAPHPKARTLITTRGRRYDQLAQSIDLNRLSPDEGYELLTSRRPAESNEDGAAAHAIVEDLGGHPLALSIAAHLLKERTGLVSFAMFRAQLAKPTKDVLELADELRPELPNGHEASIATTLLRSIEGLPTTALDLLRIASSLALAPIPTDFLAEVLRVADTLDADTVLEAVIVARSSLNAVSLVDTPSDDARSVSVHALVSRTIRFTEADSARAAALAAAATTVLLKRLEGVEDYANHETLAELLVHGREFAAGVTADDPDLERIAIAALVARYDHVRGDWAVALPAERKVLAAYEAALAQDDERLIKAMDNLAHTLNGLAQYTEARTLSERALDLCDPQAPLGLKLTFTLALIQISLGESTVARASLEQIVESYGRSASTDTPAQLAAELALAYLMRVDGDLADAQKLQERVLTVRTATLTPGQPEIFDAMAEVATTLRAAGHLERSCDLAQQAVAGCRDALGDEHPSTVSAINSLATTLGTLGRFGEARELAEHVMDSQRRLLGARHPNTAAAINNLAQVVAQEGDFKGSRRLQEQALDLITLSLGPKHPKTFQARDNLANILGALGDHKTSSAMLEATLEHFRQAYGPEHPYTLEAMGDAGRARNADGRASEALELLEPLLLTTRRLFGPDHPRTLIAANSLAYALESLGRLDRAHDLLEHVVATRTRDLGDEHPETLLAIGNLAAVLDSRGDVVGAAALGEQVLAVQRRVRGTEHPDTIISITNLGEYQRSLGETKLAYELHQEALELANNLLGADHSVTLNASASLARSLEVRGAHARALKLREQVLDGRRRALGDDHPDTINAMRGLARSLTSSGDPRGAEALMSEAKRRSRSRIPQRRVTETPGRNDPCHCNSGKKYKNCHGG